MATKKNKKLIKKSLINHKKNSNKIVKSSTKIDKNKKTKNSSKSISKKPKKPLQSKLKIKPSNAKLKSVKSLNQKKIDLKISKSVSKKNKSSEKKSIAIEQTKKITVKEEKKLNKTNQPEKKEFLDQEKTLKKSKKTEKNNEKNNQPFKLGDYAVYPSHGIGKIIEIQTNIIANQEISFYVLSFEKEKLVIKIPVNNTEKIGLRRVVSKSQMEEVLGILRSGIKKLKGMWSRRAQEYETKINSGDIFLLAEVLRDLTRDIDDSERSYSERIIYETAIHRLASEYAIIYHVDIQKAQEKIINIAKDKINSENKSKSKDDFDEFDMIERKSKIDGEDEEDEDDEEEEEEDDFNYDFNEIADEDDEDDKPKKKKK